MFPIIFYHQHMPPVFSETLDKSENKDNLNSNDVQLIGYLVNKVDVYIGHICSKGNRCIGHYLDIS